MKLSLALVSIAALFVPQALAIPGCYSKSVSFTNYWMAKEGTVDMDNNGNILHLTGPKTSELKDGSGHVIAKVSYNTFQKCKMEGTCLLESGILVNLDSGTTFEVVNRHQDPYGLGNSNLPLVPFVSVALNDVPQKTKLMINALKGRKLPNGKTHNGCVRVDDTSWSFGGCHIDWFVLSYGDYVQLNTPENSAAEAEDCEILNYITQSILDWALLTPESLQQTPPSSSSSKKGKKGKKGKTSKSSPKGPSCKTNDDCAGVTCCAINGNYCTNDNSAGTVCM